MQNLEQQLYEIADKQGVNVNEIIMLVRENEDILEKQRNNLKVSKSYCGDLYILYFNIESLNHTLSPLPSLSHKSKHLSATWPRHLYPPISSAQTSELI